MSIRTNFVSCVVAVLLATAFTVSVPARAGEAGAFIGGVVTAKVLNNMERRTEAEERQAANSSQQAAPAPAPAPAAQTPEQRLAQLDKLAAGGYITPEEYKAKKQAILDSM